MTATRRRRRTGWLAATHRVAATEAAHREEATAVALAIGGLTAAAAVTATHPAAATVAAAVRGPTKIAAARDDGAARVSRRDHHGGWSWARAATRGRNGHRLCRRFGLLSDLPLGEVYPA